MKNKTRLFLLGAFTVVCMTTAFSPSAMAQKAELLFTAELPGDQTDLSGLEGKLSDDSPNNLFGGISGMCSGTDGQILAVADRGPKDGAVYWHCRYHVLQFDMEQKSVKLVKTVLLSDEWNRPFLGRATNYQASTQHAHRFDPEGIVLQPNGEVIISDEYGPHVVRFRDGKAVGRVPVADNLLIANPGPDKPTENKNNRFGRSANRGMEGVTTVNDGTVMLGLMQSSLLQDSAFNEKGKPYGYHARIWKKWLGTIHEQQFVYKMDGPKHKLHEIAAINEREFLVLENDGEVGGDSKIKRVYRINTTGATNVRTVQKLSPNSLGDSIQPVKKTLVIDLLDPEYGLQQTIPEKIEGLAFGPMVDGRQTLLIAVDNDFEMKNPTKFYVFALPQKTVVTE